MTNKTLSRILILLTAISMSITLVMFSYAEETESTSSQASSSSEVLSSNASSEINSVESSVSSEIASSEQIVSSEPEVASSEAAVVSSTVSSSSSKKQTTSSKKQTTSSKKSSSKANTPSKSTSNGYTGGGGTGGYVQEYTEDNESTSDKWEGKDTELESKDTSSSKKLSSHMTNPKKEILKWMFLPVLISLICIGVLVYTNMFLYKKGKYQGRHSAKSKGGKKEETIAKENESRKNLNSIIEEIKDEPESDDSDPFSADNFFNFDDDK